VLNLHPAEISEATLRLPIQSGDWIHVPPAADSDELRSGGSRWRRRVAPTSPL